MRAFAVIAGAIVLAMGCVLLKVLDSGASHNLIGTAVACSNDFPFNKVHAEILEYGLQDVRGLACDAAGQNIFLAEGKRSPLVYSARSGSMLRTKRLLCPDSPCELTDRRGLAFLAPSLYVAEHGRAELTSHKFGSSGEAPLYTGDLDSLLGRSTPLHGKTEILTAPSGVAAADQMLFVSNDPAEDSSGKNSGGLFTCSWKDCTPELIGPNLHHPSGVAAAGKDGPVYVAEMRAHQVDWLIFQKTSDRGWIKSGALGAVPFAGTSAAPFLGIALDDSRSMVFAAGPGGLYVFTRGGRNLGRIVFDEPVTGVSSCGKEVYFVAGHLLCRLTIP